MLPTLQIDFRKTPVTLIITALAASLEVVCTLDERMRSAYYMDYRLGILSPIWDGEVWRPLTTTLLHGSLLHVAFNIYWMLIFGSTLELRFGSWRTLALVVLLSYVSMLPQFVITNYNQPLDQQIGGVGLSGVVYGLFGMLWVGRRYAPELREVCTDSTIKLFIGWFVLCVVLTRLDLFPVANIAHFSGGLFGVLYGQAIFDRKHRTLFSALSAVASLVVLTTMFYCPGHVGYEYHRQRHARFQYSAAAEDAVQHRLRRHSNAPDDHFSGI